jgi:CPA1 family monovalent cation:H+ antiporter
VVVFTVIFGLVTSGVSSDALLQPARLADLGVELVVVSVGGLFVGLAAGYGVYGVLVNLDEHMTEVVLTLILAYGSFVVAEHYLHVSGVIATVSAGLFIGNRGADRAMSARTKVSVFATWETAAFLANTFIFVAIGARTPVGQLLDNAGLIAAAIVLVLVARAAVVYPTMWLVNRRSSAALPGAYSHVLVWGGLHASIPIALVLGIPATAPVPRGTLTALVFGVAAFSLVVQGLTMGNLLDRLGVVTRTESEQLYELLVGRARMVSAALDAAEALYESGDISRDVYRDFEAEYSEEQSDLDRAIAALLDESPALRREQLLMGERQVLRREKSAIVDAARTGVLADDVADRLDEEVDLKLDAVNAGHSTVTEEGEGYREFWRERVEAFGLDVDVSTAPPDDTDVLEE